jgi:hypothetical protein
MEAVVAEDRGRSEFALTHKAAMAAFVGLSVAFEVVLEAAIFPERVDAVSFRVVVPASRLCYLSGLLRQRLWYLVPRRFLAR